MSKEHLISRNHLTTEEFIRRGREVHGDRFDYSMTRYGSSMSEFITVRCIKHNEEITLDARSHLLRRQGGCEYCRIEAAPLNSHKPRRKQKSANRLLARWKEQL